MQCGADTFTIVPFGENLFQDVLRTYYIGLKKTEVPVRPDDGRRFERLRFWRFSDDSLRAIVRLCPEWLDRSSVNWGFYRNGEATQLFMVLCGKESYFVDMAVHQWEALFRLGFRFSFRDFHIQEFTEADLSENKLARDAADAAANVAEQERMQEIYRESFRTATDEEKREAYEEAERALEVLRSEMPPNNPTPPQQLAYLLDIQDRLWSHPPPGGHRKPTPGADSNKYILGWWSATHDELLKEHIRRVGWKWWPSLTGIESLTPKESFLRWQREDPKCLSSTAREVLSDFARARAESLGYMRDVQWPPDARNCLLCGDKFFPKDHWGSLQQSKHVVDNICHTCVYLAIKGGGISASRKEVLTYLRKLTEALGRIPHQDFGSHYDLAILDETNVVPVMRILRQKPSEMLVKGFFGSWLAALVEAGVLEGGVRRTFFGTQCLAKDGHVCLSLAEKTIDDLLTEMGIAHEKEVPYPEGRYRCDFVCEGVFVEYFGLSGDADYDEKTKAKQKLCKQLGLRLVAIFPEDLSSGSTLKKKLESIKASS
jgi:hypothetical protein